MTGRLVLMYTKSIQRADTKLSLVFAREGYQVDLADEIIFSSDSVGEVTIAAERNID